MISHETSALSETAVVREQWCHHLQLLHCTPRDVCVCMRVFVKGVFFARFFAVIVVVTFAGDGVAISTACSSSSSSTFGSRCF